MYLIGYILKPQGIKGEVKVEAVTHDVKRFNRLDSVILHSRNIKKSYSIENIRFSDRYVYIKFNEINSRNEADLLRKAEVLIEKKDLILPGKDEYFVHDLIGCQIFSENNDHIGILSDVIEMSSNDIYVVKNNEGKELLIPAVKEIVRHVDINQKKIIIRLLEGLVD